MKLFRWYILICTLVTTISLLESCKPKYSEEEIPSYVRVNTCEVVNNNVNFLDTSQKITDVWMSVNGQLLGAFEMPVTVPVLASGKSDIICYAGVKENGISTTRVIYPFLVPFKANIDLQKENLLTVKPSYKYDVNTKLAINESFESNSWQWEKDSGFANIDTIVVPEGIFNKGRALRTVLKDGSEGGKYFRINAKNILNKININRPAWIEISFSANVNIIFGSTMINPSAGVYFDRTFLTLSATGSNNWNKLYINFNSFLRDYGLGYIYRPFFYAEWDGSSPENTILIDNIKLLYFE